MKYSSISVLVLMIVISACSSSKNNQSNSSENVQAISALGDTLYAPKPSSESYTKLQDAQKAYATHSDSSQMAISYGNQMIAQKQYRKAISLYSKEIKKQPENEQLYEKQGQIYIITRQFDKAVADLTKATNLMDKARNKRDSKASLMLHTDTWFQLGLAWYVKGNFIEAANAFQKSLDKAPADNMRVKSSYWLYMSLRRAGQDLQVGKVLEPINAEMKITENETYLKLLLVFKGDFDEKSLLNDADAPQKNITIGYGLGNWHYINGRKDHARKLFQKVYGEKSQWDKPGYIAAETDLARLRF